MHKCDLEPHKLFEHSRSLPSAISSKTVG
jgi:hypothetical protein